ncbi:MAG: plastocyanin/azurin family copper-binding protein [Verrucomicrobiota bacterium]|nr:plastocyanin/azurin family copper-binding protein [Verrucomicrobiota bacterium]
MNIINHPSSLTSPSRPKKESGKSPFARWLLLLALVFAPQVVHAQWQATVGAQNHDKGHQALAFLPNEIWIHVGEDITWHFDVDEIHTVTFLRANQPRPFFPDGCPGFSTSPATFNGSTCVTTPPLVRGSTFTVRFPTAGNFKLTCLIHENMSGAIHVLASNLPLPHDQAFYDRAADDRRRELLAEADGRTGDAPKVAEATDNRHEHDNGKVSAGTGEVLATGGGSDSVSVVRFQNDPTEIRAGQTVEWTNVDPTLPHTITFGAEPPGNPVPPSPNVTVDADGARHAVIASLTDSAHSGFIVAAPQERLGLPQAPLGTTRFRVTFPHAGRYPYICVLHDNLGMKGTVIVH